MTLKVVYKLKKISTIVEPCNKDTQINSSIN